jgi:hypothetical protein
MQSDVRSKAADTPIDVYTLALASLAVNADEKIKKPGERT